MVSNLGPVSMIFALSLFDNSFTTLAKYLGGTTLNVYRITMVSALRVPLGPI